MNRKLTFVASLSALIITSSISHANNSHTTTHANGHAPIGVMGDHVHNKGEFMFSYRLMKMQMSGNLQGTNKLSNDEIVSSIVNPNAPPATVRVVPQNMTSDMHMLGVMYAPTDHLTLLAMLNYISRDMTLTTYQGMAGTTELGNFNTTSSGVADAKLGALYRLFDSPKHKLHANFGWIIPTGSVDSTDLVLTPMNTRMKMRLPYSMQTGSGSHQGEIGLTYNGYAGNYSWGIQGLYTAPFSDNDEGYKIGNKTQFSTWTAYALTSATSASVRLKLSSSDQISGADPKIMAPVTTANPLNYGVDTIELGLGINTVVANKHRLAVEYSMPIAYDVNGVQMDMDSMLTLGYQIAF